jgi:manganese/zinc/iron transport system substrate-binding protein
MKLNLNGTTLHRKAIPGCSELWKQRLLHVICAWLMVVALAGCSSSGGQGGGATGAGDRAAFKHSGGGPIQATATTGMITDIVQNVGGDRVRVQGLMGPGVDPHLYKTTPGDIRKLTDADIVFYNGLHLEGKMGDVLEKIGERRPVVAVGEGIDEKLLVRPAAFQGHPDPHVWFDVSLWMKAVEAVRDALSEFDPSSSAAYKSRAAAYLTKLKELHQYAKTQLATIPKSRRVLVTAHDAFGYFGRAYDVEVQGLQGISTASEYSVQDVQRLAALISKRGIKAVFVESSVPRRSVEAVVQACQSKGQPVQIGGTLFSDAMGRAGTPEGTYIGMVRYNVDTIVKALK